MKRIFLLSPAHCDGQRARLLCRKGAVLDLARRLRHGGAPLGETFSFLSGLYFRGKLAYATRFGAQVWVITPNRGLLPASGTITLTDLRAFAQVDIDEEDPRYYRPLKRDARRLPHEDAEIVLLGSIATGKYLNVLQECFDGQLRFPREFIGRGDMSRGALMLRCVQEGRELEYITPKK